MTRWTDLASAPGLGLFKPLRASARALGVADAGASSASNFAVQAFAAATMSAAQFGLFSIAFTGAIWLIGLSRCSFGEIDLLRGERQAARGLSGAITVFIVLAFILGVVAASAAYAAGSETGIWLSAALLLSGPMVLQDALRHRAFVLRRPGSALLSDLVWLLLVVLGAILLQRWEATPFAFFSGWAAAALIACAFFSRAVWPGWRLREGRHWYASNGDLIKPVGAEYVLQSGVPLITNIIIAQAVSLEALAGYRVAQLLFAVPVVLAAGLNMTVAPRLARNPLPGLMRRELARQASIVTAVSTVMLLSGVFLPQRVGSFLFGESWLVASAFLLPAAVHAACNSASVSNTSAMRLLDLARFSFLVRLVAAPAALALVLISVRSHAGAGAAWALAGTALASYVIKAAAVHWRLRSL